MAKVVCEGWMVRYGRRKIGKSFFHMRYFVLETRLLAYYKRKPTDTTVPLKTLVIDGNCRVEDRGLKTHQGHMVYVLCVYNKKETNQQIMMAAYNIQDALNWKEKIELVIDQQHGSVTSNDNRTSVSSDLGLDIDRNESSSSHERHPEDEEDNNPTLLPGTTIGNGPPDSVLDWTRDQVSPRKHWRLVSCQNGKFTSFVLPFLHSFLPCGNFNALALTSELKSILYVIKAYLDVLLKVTWLTFQLAFFNPVQPRRYSKTMKAVGVVDATCEAIFELVMTMDGTRFEWDCSFQHGSLVEEVDGHTAILYHRLQLEWFSRFVWPRDLCYVRYWRRNDDGSYVVLFRSREHPNCGPQRGFVRAHIESGGFKISPLKSRDGRPRTQVQQLMQIDLKGWFVGYFPSFQQHSLLHMLNSVAGIRELFSQTDEIHTANRIPIMVSMTSDSVSSKKEQKTQEISFQPGVSLDQVFNDNRQPVILDEDSDEDEDNQVPEAEEEGSSIKTGNNIKQPDIEVETSDTFDTSCFSGNLRWDDGEESRNCWRIPDGNIFKVRSENFFKDKSKIPAGKYLMELVAVDWLKNTKRMDHVARRTGCAAQIASEKGLFTLVINLQIPGSTHYSMVFYYVKKQLVPGSLLQRFADGDDEFRNSRLKLIPSVPKGSWIVRQSVGSNPCLLGKAVDCSYIRGEKYLELDVDIGSSAVANGVLGLVCGVLTSLVVDMAFLIQAVTSDELPERLIGAVRVSHVELSSAVVTDLADSPPEE
ncbi:START domain containing protein [Musa troglodytarum]|uniref:START domain containing protein n=1 Tax=Musa troglodytarum TaxID=320322 RepID=A0A9E7K0D5_9LILI|nr:START domain containing protein [Musa troglodytarum]